MGKPFGLTKGMQLHDINEDAEQIGYGLYLIQSVPKPHSAFEKYILRVAPRGGLYAVKAIGNNIKTDSGGYAVRAEFEKIKQKLEASYGKHLLHDFLMAGSKWDESLDWMMGLVSQERTLSAYWDRDEKSSLPEDIEMIGLSASAAQTDVGYITLEYVFNNSKVCKDELEAAEDDAL